MVRGISFGPSGVPGRSFSSGGWPLLGAVLPPANQLLPAPANLGGQVCISPAGRKWCVRGPLPPQLSKVSNCLKAFGNCYSPGEISLYRPKRDLSTFFNYWRQVLHGSIYFFRFGGNGAAITQDLGCGVQAPHPFSAQRLSLRDSMGPFILAYKLGVGSRHSPLPSKIGIGLRHFISQLRGQA